MDTELRCLDCINKVVKDTRLLHGSNGWILGADGKRHWVRDGAAVCGTAKVLDWKNS